MGAEHHLVDCSAEGKYIAEREFVDSNKDGVLQLAEHQGEDCDGQLNLEELPALVDTLTSWQNINESSWEEA